MLVVVIPRCIVPQADRCLRCFVPACGSATALCTLSGTACGVPSKLSDRLRNVGSTSSDKDALVGAWNDTYYGKWIFKILSRYWNILNKTLRTGGFRPILVMWFLNSSNCWLHLLFCSLRCWFCCSSSLNLLVTHSFILAAFASTCLASWSRNCLCKRFAIACRLSVISPALWYGALFYHDATALDYQNTDSAKLLMKLNPFVV